jgi:hypothetical protein
MWDEVIQLPEWYSILDIPIKFWQRDVFSFSTVAVNFPFLCCCTNIYNHWHMVFMNLDPFNEKACSTYHQSLHQDRLLKNKLMLQGFLKLNNIFCNLQGIKWSCSKWTNWKLHGCYRDLNDKFCQLSLHSDVDYVLYFVYILKKQDLWHLTLYLISIYSGGWIRRILNLVFLVGVLRAITGFVVLAFSLSNFLPYVSSKLKKSENQCRYVEGNENKQWSVLWYLQKIQDLE